MVDLNNGEVAIRVKNPEVSVQVTAPGHVNSMMLTAGPAGKTGDKGDQGDQGNTGPANTLAIGTVAAGALPSATVTGASPNQTLNLVLPKGDTGNTGPAGPSNSLSVGTVTTGAAGSSASAAITGTAPVQTLSLTIPRGDTGSQGLKGDIGNTGPAGPPNTLAVGTVTTGAAGSAAAASITGSAPSQTLSLTIPQGVKGDKGDTGDTGPAGSGTGDVLGPASATDNAVVRFNATTGKLLQNSLVTVDDAGNMAGLAGLAMTPSTGTAKPRFGGLPGVEAWTGMFLNAAYVPGSGWLLDDATKPGWFFKLDSRTTSPEFAVYRIPAGAGYHTDEAILFRVDTAGLVSVVNRITGVANATTSTDAIPLGQADARYATPTTVTTASTADRDRANHTGTQPASTITGLATVATSGAYTDLSSKPTLGDAAAKNTGTAAGTLAAGDDTRITGAAQKASNLSDLASATTARTNLGLGTAAVTNTGTGATNTILGNDARLSDARTPTAHGHAIADLPVATSGTSNTTQLVRADDSRLSNSRTPTAHKTTHATGGSDALAPQDIGAAARTLGGREAVAAASGTTGTITLDCSAASIFTVTPTGAITPSLTNAPASGNGCTITLIVSQGATAQTVNLPTGGVWLGSAPTQTANKKCVITMLTTDAGSSWLCSGVVQA